jgi:hypothetical protein
MSQALQRDQSGADDQPDCPFGLAQPVKSQTRGQAPARACWRSDLHRPAAKARSKGPAEMCGAAFKSQPNATNITVLLSSRPWGRGPLPAGRVEVRLRRDSRHGCRLSPVGPRKAHRGVPCAGAPPRGHPEPKRRANGGGRDPKAGSKAETPRSHNLRPINLMLVGKLATRVNEES